MEWLPIDTVPINEKSDYFFCIVSWGPEDDKSTGYAMRYKGDWFVGVLFYRGGRFDERQYEFREQQIQPTHWTHGPEAPQAG